MYYVKAFFSGGEGRVILRTDQDGRDMHDVPMPLVCVYANGTMKQAKCMQWDRNLALYFITGDHSFQILIELCVCTVKQTQIFTSILPRIEII